MLTKVWFEEEDKAAACFLKFDLSGGLTVNSLPISLPPFFSFFFCVCVCVCVCLFRAAPTVYGGFQNRGGIGAAAASLHHSSRQHWTLNPLSQVRDRTCVLVDPSRVHYH